MTDLSRSSGKKMVVGISLPPELVGRVDELAKAAGLRRAEWLAQLLGELIPRIERAAPRLEVKFRAARDSEVEKAYEERGAPTALRPNRGTPFEQAGGR